MGGLFEWWINSRISVGTDYILKPVGEALGEVIKALFTYTMQSLPPVLVIGGLVCFMFTIVTANQRPYFWGLALWVASAIVRGFTIEAGY